MQQQAQIQQQKQQQALQEQTRRAQIQRIMEQQAIQRQALQRQTLLQEEALQLQIQRQAVENLRQQKDAFTLDQSNPIRDYTSTNEPYQPLASRKNENTQELIDEIVRKVIQETRGVFDLQTTRQDIEKIVRKILLEYTSNTRENILDTNRINRYRDIGFDSTNYHQNSNGMNTNTNSLVETFNPQNTITYPNAPSESINPPADCMFNCGSRGNSYSDGQPIAVAMANSFYSLNKPTDPRVLANSFTYTSV